ncbi:MAG: zinc-dependent metalloprotease [Chitinophagales bacterium]
MIKRITSLAVLLLLIQVTASAGPKDKEKKIKGEDVVEVVVKEKKEEPPFKEIKEVTKKCKEIDGLFTIYQDTTNGNTFLSISEDQIGKEFIYFKHILDGVLEAQMFKGAYRDIRIFKIEKYYDQIQLIEQNTSYYFDPESALAKVDKANINEPVVYSSKIVGMSKDTSEAGKVTYLIPSDDMFMGETINQVKPSPNTTSSAGYNLGKLDKSKSKYKAINNYPENLDVIVDYAFENPYPSYIGGDAVTNARYTSILIQHSFIALPENDFKPRLEDSRVGYFTDKITDLTSMSHTPYKDVIKRWYLTKKDPSAAVSEPVEPIVWWIENTTPVEIRDIIKEATLKWNLAFEKAGFKNALQVKVQPDTAQWDAGDIRYNVMRWTSSPNPPFGGYGPSLSNPRTGQILGADIMLEFVYLTNRLRFEKYFDLAAMNLMDELEVAIENADEHYCTAGLNALYENIFSTYAMEAMGLDEGAKSEMLNQWLQRLILHELGHTLGLTHNFCGSELYSIDEMNDPNIGGKNGIASSVMDYHATNVSLDREKQGNYALDKPGVYDDWAIQYGYTEYENEAAEKAGLAALLSRSSEPELCYGNDADDMRAPGRGIDPRFNVGDLSSDAIGFAISRIKLVEQTLPKLKENIVEEGDSYHELRSAYLSVTGNYSSALDVISRYIGGVYVNRSRAGQEPGAKPFTPVPYEEQKRAMSALNQYAFSPTAFQFDNEIVNYLKMQRRGFGFRGNGEDPQMHGRVLNAQKGVLDHLFHKNVLERITDTELYGNKYSVAEMFSDLTAAIFDADIKTNVNTYRQNIQLEYVNRLGNIMDADSKYDYISQSAALNELNKIKSKMGNAQSLNEATKAHRKHVVYAINEILDVD